VAEPSQLNAIRVKGAQLVDGDHRIELSAGQRDAAFSRGEQTLHRRWPDAVDRRIERHAVTPAVPDGSVADQFIGDDQVLDDTGGGRGGSLGDQTLQSGQS